VDAAAALLCGCQTGRHSFAVRSLGDCSSRRRFEQGLSAKCPVQGAFQAHGTQDRIARLEAIVSEIASSFGGQTEDSAKGQL